MKKILILKPKNIKIGEPSYERITSYIQFYKLNNIEVIEWITPITFGERIKLVLFLYKHSIYNIFISMPPFRNWFLFLLPNINLVMDIRDGWSIAIKSGYGGTAKPNKLKSFIASLYERFAISRASLTITCTNGLKEYLEKLTSNQIIIITNGYSKSDFETVNNLKKERIINLKSSSLVAVCAGQFSEYGYDKVKKILTKINQTNISIVLKLIGSNEENNKWIYDWLKENGISNIDLQILSRMNREAMYKEIIFANYGIAVIRDPNYEFGTKVFDYILCGIPIFDYFEEENNFVNFFKEQLTSSKNNNFNVSFLRDELIEKNTNLLLGSLK